MDAMFAEIVCCSLLGTPFSVIRDDDILIRVSMFVTRYSVLGTRHSVTVLDPR